MAHYSNNRANGKKEISGGGYYTNGPLIVKFD